MQWNTWSRRCCSGLSRRVDSWVDTDVSDKHTVSIFTVPLYKKGGHSREPVACCGSNVCIRHLATCDNSQQFNQTPVVHCNRLTEVNRTRTLAYAGTSRQLPPEARHDVNICTCPNLHIRPSVSPSICFSSVTTQTHFGTGGGGGCTLKVTAAGNVGWSRVSAVIALPC
jgi:hypothetical protein